MRTTNPSERSGERGFMMVALLVGMAIGAIYMTVALPAWRQQAQRIREEELIFRGEQYARAIMLFQNKNRGALPPDIDTLVSQHFLRKKWKDPVTNEDFIPVGIGVVVPGQASQPQTTTQTPGRGTPQQGGSPLSSQQPGISGVRSKSNGTSIKIYQNQQQYSLWQFDAALYRNKIGRSLPQQQGQTPGRGGEQAPPRGGQQGVPPRGGQQVAPGRNAPPPPPPVGAPPGRTGGS